MTPSDSGTPTEIGQRLRAFVSWAARLKGDEKGEAQIFCEHLFQAFGHAGLVEAGAELEHRSKGRSGTTRFLDLVWKPRLLLEMKKRGEKLNLHFQQAFDYWIHAVPNRPRYVVLCNFDEFWIYDFDKQIDEPMDVVRLIDLPKRYTALNFLFPTEASPQFDNDREAVSRNTADAVARTFRAVTKRLQAGLKGPGEREQARVRAQRFTLQLVVAMFAEDIELLPRGIVQSLIMDSLAGQSSYDLFRGLFAQMNDPTPSKGGRFRDVQYFNGGLFGTVDPIDLEPDELELLKEAGKSDWSQVNPAIFGTLFQSSMDSAARHALGAHFTSEADILRVVGPTIIQPWLARIDATSSMKELLALRKQLLAFRVLDPACGSGNFCYVAYRSLVRVELALLDKIKANFSDREFHKNVQTLSLVSPKQFFGIDRDPFAVELAKVTMMLSKKLALDEATNALERTQVDLDLEDRPLPLDNLDANFTCADALFIDWPAVDAIISNPPYQSKNNMQEEFGRAYVNRLRKSFPDVPGRADYCVYWFRRAHDSLKPNQRAGLVGTNTIRQNYSREGGLDYIVSHGGEIIDAVSTQVWSGEAVVHVSIVNWLKGTSPGPKRLSRQVGDSRDSPWESKLVGKIDAALTWDGTDVTTARPLKAYAALGGCYQGQTHGHKGFLLPNATAEGILTSHPEYGEVLFPFLIADDFLGKARWPSRYVIDFGGRDIYEAENFPLVFKRIEETVLKDKEEKAAKEQHRNKEAIADDATGRTQRHHAGALARWWQLIWRRADMLEAIARLPRYIVCARVTKRPVFAFVDPEIHPNDALMVFPYADDYSFGILQSDTHWRWFVARCSTFKADFRYTSNTVFDSFPWPQTPTKRAVKAVADAAVELRRVRDGLIARTGKTLREVYRTLDKPGANPLKNAHAALDSAVRSAYGMTPKSDSNGFILALNRRLAEREAKGEKIVGPGVPPIVKNGADLTTADALKMRRS